MAFVGLYNPEVEKGKNYFNSLIKNEDEEKVKQDPCYGDTRTIYVLNNKGFGLYLYHYYALLEKIYNYRKSEMEKYDNLVIRATFDLREKEKKNDYYHDINVLSENISQVYSYDDFSYDFYKNKKLLEAFYEGKLDGMYRLFAFAKRTFRNDEAGFRPFFPRKIKAFRNFNNYYTNEVIRVPDNVRTLDYLVDGDLAKYTSSSNVSIEQLDCFEFDEEPYDEISLDLLDELYGTLNDKKILLYSKDSIIDYAINQAEANEEIMRLVKERRKM